jgi:hypothetical protein
MNITRITRSGVVAGLATGLAALAALASPANARSTRPERAVAFPRAFPAGPTWNTGGSPLTWSRLRGRVVIVDFWNFK